jgi:tRNA modification GTPase
MRSLDTDTIVAVATAPGRGGIGIIRLSGPRAQHFAEALTHITLQPRFAHFSQFHAHDSGVLDSGIALFYPGPASFTGEDVTELQAHGGPVILDLLVKECCRLGARLAEPGEFSQRAFLNGKLDLVQAEAIADLINSTTEQAALNASHSLQGAFSSRIDSLQTQLTALRIYIEAAIDFPEEEIDFLEEGKVAQRLQLIIDQLSAVELEAKQGALVQEGMKLVITGRPNAGKSSLLNALSGQDTAIVTAIEGTTRDVLRQHIQIDGMPLHIVDTAGLRESTDEIEKEGIRRARKEMLSADRILLVVDATSPDLRDRDRAFLVSEIETPETRKVPVTIIYNKCDLLPDAPDTDADEDFPAIYLSAKHGEGMETLRTHLKKCMGYEVQATGQFSARRRHLQSLETASQCLLRGQQQLLGAGAGELLAEDLRLCQGALGEITGDISADELLGQIFSSFCIGK